uniref:PPM-type phosphatase domain-containing protein n=1 Tax=Paramoeba aestuarina TaxID=180227 RepID=A0A7S4P0N3_9EUKA|mmetsp:Transcript_34148/g.53393  ORF Transcript_34148/g.53393 Transcript_34148/m.53393 type:complete len:368 (+) Transcript_34148:79-1182(+)|eukprot:CAMPEP_0201534632 /NCGR_PEP_ID=MMETSP0161_2-20130828/56847_1 /ASSEMBLY_ACC=CAM_ASM_000251 /TAXON_ID=180227 /ORGANISM="Neoparamoeba aestuarina, Strain SoJaBio B1-5/56/2" /LENGTH=367 /DNA_ID=CAMNT_0047939379 /DNA_START=61 /DNA_END=1164 /DNA_ORIENTATION=-
MYLVISAAAGAGILSYFLYRFFLQQPPQDDGGGRAIEMNEMESDENQHNSDNNNSNKTVRQPSFAEIYGNKKKNNSDAVEIVSNSNRNNKHSMGGGGGGYQYGIAELMGRRQTMEDTHCIVQNIGGSPYSFFAVYDGHGGDKAAKFLRDNLHNYVQTFLSEGGNPEEVLSKAVQKAEEEFMIVARETEIQDGSTVVCALVGDGHVYMANVGDSEAILARNREHLVLTTVHTPGRNKNEADRVEQAGGRLMRGRVGHPHFNPRCFNLAVSRAVGDLMYKSEEFVQDKNSGVVADADTRVVELGEGDDFVIMACDGVWDVLEYQVACDLTAGWLQQGVTAQEAVEKLVTDAFEKGSRDNITACLVVLRD